MKKRLTLLLMTIVVVMTLAACGSQDEDYVEGYKLSEIPLPQVSKTEWMYQDSYDVAQAFMDYMGYYAEDVYEMNEYPIVKWGKVSQMYVECVTDFDIYWLELGVKHEKDADGEPVDGYYLIRYYVEESEYDGEIMDDEEDTDYDTEEYEDYDTEEYESDIDEEDTDYEEIIGDGTTETLYEDTESDTSEISTDDAEALDAEALDADADVAENDISDEIQEFIDGDAEIIVNSFIDWVGLQFIEKGSPQIDGLNDDMAISMAAFAAYDGGYYSENEDFDIIISKEDLDKAGIELFDKTCDIGSFSGNEYVTKTDDGQLKLAIGDWGTLYPDYTIQNVTGDNNKFEVEVSYFTVDVEAGENSATKYTAYYTFEPSNQSEYGYAITNMRASAN